MSLENVQTHLRGESGKLTAGKNSMSQDVVCSETSRWSASLEG